MKEKMEELPAYQRVFKAIIEDKNTSISKDTIEIFKKDKEILLILLTEEKYYSLAQESILTNEDLMNLVKQSNYNKKLCYFICENPNFSPDLETINNLKKYGVSNDNVIYRKSRILIDNPDLAPKSLEEVFTDLGDLKNAFPYDYETIISHKLKKTFENIFRNNNSKDYNIAINSLLKLINEGYLNNYKDIICKLYLEINNTIPEELKGSRKYKISESEKYDLLTSDYKYYNNISKTILSNEGLSKEDIDIIVKKIVKFRRSKKITQERYNELLFNLFLNENFNLNLKIDIIKTIKGNYDTKNIEALSKKLLDFIKSPILVDCITESINERNDYILQLISKNKRKKITPEETEMINFFSKVIYEFKDNSNYIDIDDYLQDFGIDKEKFYDIKQKLEKNNSKLAIDKFLMIKRRKMKHVLPKYIEILRDINNNTSIKCKNIELFKYLKENKLGVETFQILLKENYFVSYEYVNNEPNNFISAFRYSNNNIAYQNELLDETYRKTIFYKANETMPGEFIELDIETRIKIIERLSEEGIPILPSTFNEMAHIYVEEIQEKGKEKKKNY